MSNWDGLIVPAYEASLSIMAGAAETAFAVAGPVPDPGYEGMAALMATVEKAIKDIFTITVTLMTNVSFPDVTPVFYGIVLIVPYLLLFFLYFSQVLVSMFRVMLVAVLSPFLIMAFGFPWGRQAAVAGLRTLVSAIMVLFAATAAVSLALYGVKSLNLEEITNGDQVLEMASFSNAEFLVAILLGWLGTSLMMVGTEIANSVMGSMLTNTAAAVMTAGMSGTALAAGKFLNPATAGGRLLGGAAAAGTQAEAWGTIGRGAKDAYVAAKSSEIVAKFRNIGGGSGSGQ